LLNKSFIFKEKLLTPQTIKPIGSYI
jgi:hypothetical protein